ncbi:MAG: aminopeptidase P N-terminal domain-containing protein [Candidatus Kariarchaeaceae archaeon]|jgi:Xaa-Pro aminopeptidase
METLDEIIIFINVLLTTTIMISREEYTIRREMLMEQIGKGVVIIASNPIGLFSNDKNFKFRQSTDMMYYTGFPEPESFAVIENNGTRVIYHLFVPPKDPHYETWHGRRFGEAGAKEIFQADESYSNEDLHTQLVHILTVYKTVHYIRGTDPQIDVILNSLTCKIADPTPYIHRQRSIKSAAEIEIIKQSIAISVEAHMTAIRATKPGMKEYQIEAIYDYIFRKHGAIMPTHSSIVAGGENATILHYTETRDTLKVGEMLLVDAGCEYEYYTSDISRTWPISGSFTAAQHEVYQVVLEVQKECVNMVKPGICYWDIHDYSVKKLTEGLIKLGLLEGDLDELIDSLSYKRFYMHGIGHWLGMDTHDTGTVSRETQILEPGHYLTIEPGLYIPNDEDIPEKYRGIGIRIEDNVLVTINGNDNLSEAIPREIEEVEALVGTLDNLPI